MEEIVVNYESFASKQQKTTQYVVYHLINSKTLNRYFGYVRVENVRPIIAIGGDEIKQVNQILNGGDCLMNEGAIYESIQKWGYENFMINVVDFYRTEDAAYDKVQDLIERFEKNTEYIAYNDKDKVVESIQDDTKMRESHQRIIEISERGTKSKQIVKKIEEEKEVEGIFNISIPTKTTKSQKLKNNKNAKTPLVLINKMTGEEIYFESKGECMKYLNVYPQVFASFLKGQCKKLNARWKVKLINTI